jgi:hypothetical protein
VNVLRANRHGDRRRARKHGAFRADAWKDRMADRLKDLLNAGKAPAGHGQEPSKKGFGRLPDRKPPSGESATDALSAGQANEGVKAAGAVSRDTNAAPQAVRAAARRPAPSNAAARVLHRAEGARVLHRAEAARAVRRAEAARVVRRAEAVRAADLAGRTSEELP